MGIVNKFPIKDNSVNNSDLLFFESRTNNKIGNLEHRLVSVEVHDEKDKTAKIAGNLFMMIGLFFIMISGAGLAGNLILGTEIVLNNIAFGLGIGIVAEKVGYNLKKTGEFDLKVGVSLGVLNIG
ncbi:MAG: hypothetical protein COT84_00985 [Chlamydiae bacterium CG10_big_fil_rev_8_21_14_0_10_35_9]|nr:MAG: hypothetical protein COT84_00985 [Chlamydiae bacterium CG10_big_fil_rev_8_21_14_0_10_35_9]